MRAFIDGFKLIRIESDIYIHTIELNNNQVNWLKNENFNQFFATEKPICLHQDDHIVVNDVRIPLEIGVVTLSKEFEQQFRYDGALGVDYRQDRSTFRLFTPVAKEVDVVIDQISYPMVYEMPIWMTTVFGDLEGKAYHFSVRLVDTFDVVNDPYAIGAGLHKNHIIDWNKTIPIHPSSVKLKHPVDAVLYEGHVRDLTIHLDVESKGLFDGLIEKSKLLKTSVIGYVKKLGITHLQLLPVYDFEGVDDVFKTHSYNWGYNPSQFFCVEGWFSKDPDNPYDRIDGFKKVINEAHRLGLGINMDVVFNHVYQYWTFPYDHLVPGYFYRHNARHKMTDASYCGNDIETRNYMVRKLIIDNLKHWVTHYQVDGFRFDLMGLLDLETMQQIETALKKIHPSIMLYGEGWNMPSEVPARLRSNMANQAAFPKISHFNDSFRHVMKGELHGPGLGYAMGNHALVQKAMQV
ncbi:MAG: hypothetical protein IH571_00130, partial [Acholeplasmataceae bacterium]|nr:hypothetical protein [Acholeplasmataceae bacterium]